MTHDLRLGLLLPWLARSDHESRILLGLAGQIRQHLRPNRPIREEGGRPTSFLARTLLSRFMTQPAYRFQLLAPSGVWPVAQNRMASSTELHSFHLASLQQLRGRAYLQDGAIRPSHLDAQGCYPMADDESCWHFLLVDQHEQAIGCARYLVHSSTATYDQLRIAQSPLANDLCWGRKLRRTVEATLHQTRNEQVSYAELGGWAIAEDYRNTKAALEILPATYLWAEMIGHCLCSCTATVRNHSSSILRRVGASSLMDGGEPLPAYFDAHYSCMMELLGFDSRQAPARFTPLLNEMRPKLAQSPILQQSSEQAFSVSLQPTAYRPSVRRTQISLQRQAKQSVPPRPV